MKKYNIIYADPPWAYKQYNYSTTKDGSKAKRGARKEYPTMAIDEIRNLNVASLADENCALFLWVTWPLLSDCLSVFNAWGFEYKTLAFEWIKTYEPSGKLFWGMGLAGTRANSEVCLLGMKGKIPRQSAGVHSVVMSPVGKHSAKPDIVREKIVQLFGDLPRIELFARESAPGWDVLGNDIDGTDIRTIL